MLYRLCTESNTQPLKKQIRIMSNLSSECCGAAEWIDGTGICGSCKEHAEFYDENEEVDE